MASLFRKHKAKAPKDLGKEPAVAEDMKGGAVTPDADRFKPTPAAPLLNNDDEEFLMRLLSDDDDGPPPPLPPRPRTPELSWDTDSDSVQLPRAATTTTTEAKKPGRIARLFRRKTATATPRQDAEDEADREWADLNHALSRLGIAPAVEPANSTDSTSSKSKPTGRAKAVGLTASAELQSLLNQFVVVLRDIMRGAPTAANDLVALLDGRNDVLKRGFDKLPKSLQKIVTQLPDKLTSALGPEVLAAAAAAAESQGLKRDADKKAKVKDAKGLAKFLAPRGLGDLVLTPAIVKSMLKAIVNALKLRWPAFVGTSMLWSVAIVLLLFVLWYCRKRGKEEREREEAEKAGTSAAKERSSGSSSRRNSGSSSRRNSGSGSRKKSGSRRSSRDDASRSTYAEVVEPSENRRRRSRAS
ncbi:hypothetical protein VTJ49DRAFT_4043 [Mycothermus thermophilus]|uniref:Uncharacterized protein n=1 Tax=Humicola insolens TaxID=85995 RepID=A0ABR3V6C4_HUMIN